MFPTPNNNKAKAGPRNHAGKQPAEPTGTRYAKFCSVADENPNTKELLRKWINKLEDMIEMTTRTGAKHIVRRGSANFVNDLRLVIPAGPLTKAMSDWNQPDKCGQIKVTLTWVISYLNGIRIPANGGDYFECSHRCCEYDQQGQRIVGARCIDPKCLVWESKSTNQERANRACRLICHCGCGLTVCEANNVHNPPCL